MKRVACVTVILTELGRKCVGTYGPGKRFCMCKGRIICGVEVEERVKSRRAINVVEISLFSTFCI